ncbi:MAG: phosphoribosylformylglycinamidine synthase, partial [Oligoflexales bacterium]|nr:phosphoribosylformylglycinamidine synthase [Oligoflexales bacterium]
SDPISESYEYRRGLDDTGSFSHFIDIHFRHGVTDNVGRTAEEALSILSDRGIRVYSGQSILIRGKDLDKDRIKKWVLDFFANELLQSIHIYDMNDTGGRKAVLERFDECSIDIPSLNAPVEDDVLSCVSVTDIFCHDEKIMELNEKNCWALTLDEINQIREYFRDEGFQEKRRMRCLPRLPTDVEIEIIAQTWSEHCRHKIFAADIEYSEAENIPSGMKSLGKKNIGSLYKTYIKGATHKIIRDKGISWAVSVFSDNAGVVRFDEKVDFCIKVETHNSPSALDPYGGALTGILGVNRDIMGCGLGAKPIGNTNNFCFAPCDWPSRDNEDELPSGLKHPRRILQGVHKGIEDGGNKSGIPTINGSFFFDMSYAGKPLVFCGTVGVMPQKLPDGRNGWEKGAKAKDRIMIVGGATGKDGIHGATFSSLDLSQSSPVSAVQIGDPITQKRALDFILAARDLGLYSSITDNGAGGFSSSIGEMARETGGAAIELQKAPTKYPGLRPFELMVSESQERMTLAVSEANADRFLSLAEKYGVSASDLGEFSSSGYLEVNYSGKPVALLSLDFLHESLRPLSLAAEWKGPSEGKDWADTVAKPKIPWNRIGEKTGSRIQSILIRLLEAYNITSKERWVRQYDHEVQAATIVKPFTGKSMRGPSDSGVLWTKMHGGSEHSAIAISNGLCPRLSSYDGYLMAMWAVDEAVRNLVASGANIEKISLLDNFCWPDPVESPSNAGGRQKLAALVRACEGLYDISVAYGMPLVSGKDSMKNDFNGFDRAGKRVKISVLPTLLVTGMGYIENVEHVVTTDFKDILKSILQHHIVDFENFYA